VSDDYGNRKRLSAMRTLIPVYLAITPGIARKSLFPILKAICEEKRASKRFIGFLLATLGRSMGAKAQASGGRLQVA